MVRLRADTRLALIAFFGGLSALSILPFAVYRALNQQWLAAVVDVTLVGLVAACNVYAWRTGRSQQAGAAVVAVITLASMAIVPLLGIAGLFWVYTVLVANFMLGTQRLAMIANALLIGSAFLQWELFPTTSMAVSFLTTAVLVSLYAFLFSWLTESQRFQLQDLASRDALTNVANRRGMERELAMAIEGHALHGAGAGLAVLDLDHFKHVNDTYGHDAGDHVLIDFAALVQGSIRKRDRLFRYGGEEFVVLLPAVDEPGMQRALDKVIEVVRAGLRGPGGPVRVSIGASLLRAGDDLTSWLGRADAALYLAKRSGRDRICIDDDAAATLQRREGKGGEGAALV